MADLRPDLTIKQEFVAVTPNVPATSLPTLLIGVNRNLQHQVDLGVAGYAGSTPVTEQALPGLVGGVVEDGSSDALLTPKIHISNSTYGVAEITSGVTFNNLTTSPSVTIASGVSATFSLVTGTTGTFALSSATPLASQFLDTNADFVVGRVSAGDTIKVGTTPTFEVVGLVSDEELTVKRLDKGPLSAGNSQAAKLTLSKEDADGLRTIRSTSTGHIQAGGFTNSGVVVGDRVVMDYWEAKYSTEGIAFTAVGDAGTAAIEGTTPTAADRKLTVPDGGAFDTTATAAFVTTTGVGTVFFVQNGAGEFEPAFYALSASDTDSPDVLVRDFASNSLNDADDYANVQAQWVDYAATHQSGTEGAFTAESAGTRTFTDANVADFTAVTSDGAHIAIKDTDGVYRPVFEITARTSDELTVTQFGAVYTASAQAQGVDYKIIGGAGTSAPTVNNEGAVVTLADNGDGTVDLDDSAITTGEAAVGDLVFTPEGDLVGVVSDVTGLAGNSFTYIPHTYASADLTASSWFAGSSTTRPLRSFRRPRVTRFLTARR
jgi:hypothetical protein